MEWEQAQSHSRTILMASMAKEKKKKKNSSYKRKPKASSCSSSCPKHPPVTGDSVCLQSSGEMWLCCFCAVNIPLMFPPLSHCAPSNPPSVSPPHVLSLKCWSSWFRMLEILWKIFIFCNVCERERERATAPNFFFFIWKYWRNNFHWYLCETIMIWTLTLFLLCMRS